MAWQGVRSENCWKSHCFHINKGWQGEPYGNCWELERNSKKQIEGVPYGSWNKYCGIQKNGKGCFRKTLKKQLDSHQQKLARDTLRKLLEIGKTTHRKMVGVPQADWKTVCGIQRGWQGVPVESFWKSDWIHINRSWQGVPSGNVRGYFKDTVTKGCFADGRSEPKGLHGRTTDKSLANRWKSMAINGNQLKINPNQLKRIEHPWGNWRKHDGSQKEMRRRA